MVRGRTQEIKSHRKVNANINASIHNRFAVEVVDAKTGKVKQKAYGENVVCDALWTIVLENAASYFDYIQFGTGTGTPSATDTSLFAYLGGKQIVRGDGIYNFKPGVASVTRNITILETEFVGSELTEVGIAYGSGSSTLVTHALLHDMNGNQISILKTNTDIINIYATVFVHWSTDSDTLMISSSINWGNNNSSDAHVAGGFLGLLLGRSVGSQGPNWPSRATFTDNGWHVYGDPTTTVGDATKVADVANKTLTITYPRLAASAANDQQILGVAIGAHGTNNTASAMSLPTAYMLVGGSQIPSGNVTADSIGTGDGVTTDFKTTFSNLVSATIKVNGVPQSASVDYGVPFVAGNDKAGIYPGIYADGVWCLDTTELSAPNNTKGNGVQYPTGGCLYNSFHSVCGIETVNKDVMVSDDLNTWDIVPTGTVPNGHKNKKYWRLQTETGTLGRQSFTITRTRSSDNNIHFSTPPAAGAVITADYVTNTIPKDSNHVYDLTVTLRFGGYVE